MVKFMLMITAKLENLTNLQPLGGCDDPSFPYYFKMKCYECGELSEKETCVSLDVTVPTPNLRGTTNLVQKCKLCGRVGTVQLIPGRGRPLTNVTSLFEEYTSLMLFDCNGLEPVGFVFGNGWKAESTDGTKFYCIDLSRGEYSNYDDDGQFPVKKVLNPRANFVVVN
ncbi:CXXC motif containing zinc binding protein-like [Telopea speciosissima]|uniref:CXXC motif containing zinc binding protein-like n=1 Tax=Telopea speciosissima TaxID=54955 RepID=UPI001CC669F7|nr:CXXC motif containing zinc binding protein-like [Telopea speciosissima]